MLRYLLFLIFSLFVLCIGCKPAPDGGNAYETEAQRLEDENSKGFDELSSEYYQTQSRVIWQKPELVLSLLGNLRGKTIADIGAGTGFFAFRIANSGGKVIAIDIDPRAIAWMDAEKKRYPDDVQALLETRLAAPDDPNLRAAEVDVVLMVNTYIYINDRVAYFRNLRNGLRKDARIIIIDFKDNETPIGPTLEERIALEKVESELREAGYTIETTDNQSLEYQYIITARM